MIMVLSLDDFHRLRYLKADIFPGDISDPAIPTITLSLPSLRKQQHESKL